jgi:hypothetical protein
LVEKSFSIVGSATLIAEKSLAMTTTATAIAKRARIVERSSLAVSGEAPLMRAPYALKWTANDVQAPQSRASPSPPPSGGIALGGATAARDKVIQAR